MKYTGRTSRNINIKALGLFLCILVASYGIIKAPASDTRKLEADLRKKQQLINEEKGKKVDGTSTLPSQSTSALHTTVPANNMPADTGKDITIKKHFVTVIGDSVFLGASVAFQQQCENAVVDAKISRQVVQALDVAKQLDKKHKLGDIVIIALGTNSNFNSKSGQKLIDYLGKDRTIYWIDTYGKHLDIQKDVNNTIQRVVAANKNVQRIYWSKEGEKHPDWFYQDGVHLNPHGEKKYARFIMQMIQSSLD